MSIKYIHIAGPTKPTPADAPYFPIAMRVRLAEGAEQLTAEDALSLVVRRYQGAGRFPYATEGMKLGF